MNNPGSPLLVVGLSASVYWPDEAEARRVFDAIAARLNEHAAAPLEFHLLHGAVEDGRWASFQGASAVIMPMSGGVQPLLVRLSSLLRHQALANAYLPGFLPEEIGRTLLHRNAHPACTDFFANRRLAGRPVPWLSSLDEFQAFSRAHVAVEALRSARILRLGETEPWVINSTRDPARFRTALGCEIIPLDARVLYDEFARVAEDGAEVAGLAEDWWSSAAGHADIAPPDARKAARVAVAMRRLLAAYDAQALAMACFAMIGEIDTTSCLALSTLNDAARTIGACEGDLDAAVTLFLLKHLGADFVWIANPIIHPGNFVDLAHCTAPRCACGGKLPYRLLRHHESGRGVAPEVRLPGGCTVTLARIGADLTELCVHPGVTENVSKQPTCHTQVRVHLPSTGRFLETLNGTHVVMSYGDWRRELSHCAGLLGLKLTGSADLPLRFASLDASRTEDLPAKESRAFAPC